MRGSAILVICSCRRVGYRGMGPGFRHFGREGTVRLAVVYIPRQADNLRCGGWTELH